MIGRAVRGILLSKKENDRSMYLVESQFYEVCKDTFVERERQA